MTRQPKGARRAWLLIMIVLSLILLAACDNGTPATPTVAATQPSGTTVAASTATTEQPTATTASATDTATPEGPPPSVPSPIPSPTGTVVDASSAVASPTAEVVEGSSPTPVTATGSGKAMTALEALATLKQQALGWQPDARFVMLANVRPAQAYRLLGVALGDPDVNEPTPGGKGRNWALIAASPGAKSAMSFETGGATSDLARDGVLTDDMMERFFAPGAAPLALSSLDTSKLVDSDVLPGKAGSAGESATMGIALLAPDLLGIGPLPTPEAGGGTSALAYELYTTDPSGQAFIFFDAATGNVLLNSNTP